jgi:hypothetical protein
MQPIYKKSTTCLLLSCSHMFAAISAFLQAVADDPSGGWQRVSRGQGAPAGWLHRRQNELSSLEAETAWQAEQRQAAWDKQWQDTGEGGSMDGTDGIQDDPHLGQVGTRS